MTLRIALLLPSLVFLLELILGGPGRWSEFGGLTIRYWLLLATLISMVTLAIIHGPLRWRWDEVVFFFIISIGILVWMGVVPILRWVPVHHTIADGDALFLLFMYLPLAHLVRRGILQWPVVRKWMIAASAIVAVAHLILFMFGQFGSRATGIGAAVLMRELMNSTGIFVGYVGPIYRVMWISSLFLLFAFLLVLRDVRGSKSRTLLLALFGAALVVTYTRGLWLAAALGTAVHLAGSALATIGKANGRLELPALRLRPLIKAAVVVVLLSLAAATSELRILDRMTTILDPEQDTSISVRVVQVWRLLDAWSATPLMGSGLGSYVHGYPGATDAPFSYELTGPTLLMKTGVAGLLLATLLIFYWIRRAWLASIVARDRRWFYGWLSILLGFGIAFQTNPYLVNFVGMSIVVFLMVEIVEVENRARWRRSLLVEGPGDETRPRT